MARFNQSQLAELSRTVRGRSETINRAGSLSINRALTFTRSESIRLMRLEVNLTESYIRRNLRVAGRASPNNLRGLLRANARGTLLTRYPTVQTREGVRVAVNAREGFRLIRNAFMVSNLRGSGASGVALRNTEAVQHFRDGLNPSTPAKRRKLQRAAARARNNPRGITVLSSRSINQVFTTTREEVEPRSLRFLREEFLIQFNRLNNL